MGSLALKKMFLLLMIGSLGLAAGLGSAAIIYDLGDVGTKITLTTLVLSSVGIIGLAPAIQLERRKHTALAGAALLSTFAGAGMLLASIWFETGGEEYLKWLLTFDLAACAMSLSCLLLLSKLASHFRPMMGLAIVLSWALAGMFIWGIWTNQELPWQAVSIVALLAATTSLSIPLLQRWGDMHASTSTDGKCACVNCPCCSKSVPHENGGMNCSGCGCKFSIEALGDSSKKA